MIDRIVGKGQEAYGEGTAVNLPGCGFQGQLRDVQVAPWLRYYSRSGISSRVREMRTDRGFPGVRSINPFLSRVRII